MARGSAPGERRGGRQKGTPNKLSAAIRAEIAETGETPLSYMLRVMRDETIEHTRRDWAADKAAPYIHSRLSATEVTGKDGGPIETNLPDDRSLARVIVGILQGANVKGGKT